MKTYFIILLAALAMGYVMGCDDKPDSDKTQQSQQEGILAEGTAEVGMPAITNFRERRLLKDIYELRDQKGLVTYTYLFAENTGRLKYLGESVGYGIPYATEFTNPQKLVSNGSANGYLTLPQAEP